VSGGTRDGDAEVRAAALEALGRLATPGDTVFQRLATSALADPAPLVREHAAYLAAAVGASADGIVALERAADDSIPLVRRAAVDALGQLARRRPVPPSTRATLNRALRDTSVGVRSAASEALRGMGRPLTAAP
jgi:HEAT repeat protein